MAVLSLSYHSVLTLYLINNSIYTDGLVILLYTILKKKKPLGTHLYFVIQGQTSKESESYKKGTNVDTM
jgi:hypothetical protein